MSFNQNIFLFIMKTITKQNVHKLTNNFTLESLTTNRVNLIDGGWSDVKIDPDFYEESIENIVWLLGGREATKQKVRFALRNTPVHGWFSGRIMYTNKWTYTAGQDYPNELRLIRKELTK